MCLNTLTLCKYTFLNSKIEELHFNNHLATYVKYELIELFSFKFSGCRTSTKLVYLYMQGRVYLGRFTICCIHL